MISVILFNLHNSTTIFFRNEDNVKLPVFSVLQKLSHYSYSIFLSILLYFYPPKKLPKRSFCFSISKTFYILRVIVVLGVDKRLTRSSLVKSSNHEVLMGSKLFWSSFFYFYFCSFSYLTLRYCVKATKFDVCSVTSKYVGDFFKFLRAFQQNLNFPNCLKIRIEKKISWNYKV